VIETPLEDRELVRQDGKVLRSERFIRSVFHDRPHASVVVYWTNLGQIDGPALVFAV
jgi:hypothetical protein